MYTGWPKLKKTAALICDILATALSFMKKFITLIFNLSSNHITESYCFIFEKRLIYSIPKVKAPFSNFNFFLSW